MTDKEIKSLIDQIRSELKFKGVRLEFKTDGMVDSDRYIAVNLKNNECIFVVTRWFESDIAYYKKNFDYDGREDYEIIVDGILELLEIKNRGTKRIIDIYVPY